MGYRYLRLTDQVYIREDLTALFELDANGAIVDPFVPPLSIVVQDRFRTTNTFHGVELGTVYGRNQGRWSMEMTSRISLGTTTSRVLIRGTRTNTPPGNTDQGGLLAQTSNIGDYTRDAFSVAPELGIHFSYRFAPAWRITLAIISCTGAMYYGQVNRSTATLIKLYCRRKAWL